MSADLHNEPTPPVAVPMILIRPFKSLMRTPAYIKHRRRRRTDYFISMNDNCACIPPGTPMSLVSQRTATTTESNETSSPVRNLTEDNESVISRLDKATESVSDAGACGTSESWSLLSLPTMQKANHIVQFTPSQDVSTDDDILQDILLDGIGESTTTDVTTQPITQSKDEIHVEHHLHRLAMRRLPMCDEIAHQHVSGGDVNILGTGDSPKNYLGFSPTSAEVDETSSVEQNAENTDLILSQPMDELLIADVPIIKSVLHPSLSLQALTLDESNVPTAYDMSIPKEIFCYPDEIDDEMETMIDTDPFHESRTSGKSLSSPCLLPCPKDQPFRRRPRRYSDPRDIGPDTASLEMSFFDIICRHQYSSVTQSEEEHSIPIIIIEVDRRKENELPPKDIQRHRRRSRATRDYQRRWPRRNDAGIQAREDHAPEYASV